MPGQMMWGFKAQRCLQGPRRPETLFSSERIQKKWRVYLTVEEKQVHVDLSCLCLGLYFVPVVVGLACFIVILSLCRAGHRCSSHRGCNKCWERRENVERALDVDFGWIFVLSQRIHCEILVL